MHDTQTFDKGYSQQKHACKAHTHTHILYNLLCNLNQTRQVQCRCCVPLESQPQKPQHRQKNTMSLNCHIQSAKTNVHTHRAICHDGDCFIYALTIVHVCSSVYSSCEPSIVLTIDIPDANEKYKQHIRLNPPTEQYTTNNILRPAVSI